MASAATARDKHVTAGVRVLRGIAEARTYGPLDAIMCRRMRCATDATRAKEQKINPLSRELSSAGQQDANRSRLRVRDTLHVFSGCMSSNRCDPIGA